MTKSVYFRDDFIVITGGPGAGKTTLLKELEECGYGYVPEVARDIIRKQVAINGDALPWEDKVKYRDLMLDKSIESYRLTLNESTNFLFFDRGIPDTLAYSKLISIPISEKLQLATKNYRYNTQVFILPPWTEIYQTDEERIQGIKEAIETYEILIHTYQLLGYQLIEVPKTSVKQRVEFILHHLDNKNESNTKSYK
jgi:predicted ATPase